MTAPVLRREVDGRVLAGVAAGIAAFTGVPVLAVRLALVALCFASGLGIAVYAVMWVFLPQRDGTTFQEDRRGQGLLLVVLLVVVVALVLLVPLGVVPGGVSVAPLLVAVAGVALVWQQADLAQRRHWRASALSTATGSRSALLRLGFGALLLIGGLVGFLASRGELAVARAGLASTAVVVAGIALLSSPWWVGMATDLSTERRERIRSQERAEVAAHVHDSVLQTLALIQKAAASPAEVTRLARGQERELRTWLYTGGTAEGSLSGALEALAAAVEESFQVTVDVVTVGDLALSEKVSAVVAATREAVVNAAKHSGVAAVDVYCEVEPTAVTVFVRDRGRGFDPSTVPADRHGLAGSVHGRMERHGGLAVVRSSAGDGTEVRLEMPL
ncbi:MAG: Conserved putative rane protein [Frankiales bacterium]|nr:Conserved putative rane protein [Frankiales bacterium]